MENDYPYTIYDITTGKYVRGLGAPTVDDALLNVGEGEVLVLASYASNTYFDPATRNVYECNTRGDWDWIWNAEEKIWEDPDPEHSAFKGVLVRRMDVLRYLLRQKMIQEAELTDLIMGKLPSAVSAKLPSLDQAQRLELRLWWGEFTVVLWREPRFDQFCDLLGLSMDQRADMFKQKWSL